MQAPSLVMNVCFKDKSGIILYSNPTNNVLVPPFNISQLLHCVCGLSAQSLLASLRNESQIFIFKKRLKTLLELGSCLFFVNMIQTRVNSAFVGNYFQMGINRLWVLE